MGNNDFDCAVTFTIVAEESCFASGQAAFPERFGMFNELELFLVEPLNGILKAGPAKFRVKADPAKISQLVMMIGSPSSATGDVVLEMQCTDGVYELDVEVEAPQVTIAGTPSGRVSGDLATCLKWVV